MATLALQLLGGKKTINKLNKMQDHSFLGAPISRAVIRIKSFVSRYPAQRNPDTRYVRGRGMKNAAGIVTRRTSQNLGKRWTHKVSVSTQVVTGRVGNNVSYAPWVHSHRYQAGIHRNWWRTDRDAIREHRGVINKEISSAIHREINK